MKMKLGVGRMNVDAWLRGTLRGPASECATVGMNEWYVPVWIQYLASECSKNATLTGKSPDRVVHVMSSQIVSSPHTEVCPRIVTCTTRDPQVASDVKDREVSGDYNTGGCEPRGERIERENKVLVSRTDWWGHRKGARFSSALVSMGGG